MVLSIIWQLILPWYSQIVVGMFSMNDIIPMPLPISYISITLYVCAVSGNRILIPAALELNAYCKGSFL